MPSTERTLQKMRNNPRDWRIEDLQAVARHFGVDTNQHGTSHVMFRHPRAGRLSVPAHKPVQPVYVREFIKYIDRLEVSNE
jgi:hypothetical protein